MHVGIPDWWGDGLEHLGQDPIMGKLIEQYGSDGLKGKGNLFETLIRSIVGQQISAIAADAIWKRLCDLVVIMKYTSFENIIDQQMRDVGLSFRKIEYIRGIIDSWPYLSSIKWSELDDSMIRKELILLRGIGPWTVDMILIFNLLRPDVLPLGDVGIVRMIEKLYANGRQMNDAELLQVSEKWSPYRTVASWYLWRGLDPEPVEY